VCVGKEVARSTVGEAQAAGCWGRHARERVDVCAHVPCTHVHANECLHMFGATHLRQSPGALRGESSGGGGGATLYLGVGCGAGP